MTGRLLTTRDVADLPGLSTETVLRRWRRGDVPGGIRLASNVLRFRESAIEEWLFELERESWSCVGPDRGVGCGRP
jgi:predicted DNA-binding transcriptional regulator AlpA